MTMGRQKQVDKTVRPLTSLTNLTPATVTGGRAINQLGNIPIGVYKGAAAFWDLDKAVNQPLVTAEQQHIMGILSGREAAYDLAQIAVVAADPIGTAHVGTITVPTGELWFVNAVEGFSPANGAGSQVGYNWYCSMWTDRVGALGHGQAFHGAEQVSAVNTAQTVTDDFHYVGAVWAVTNKPVMLRLPAGTVLTAIFSTRTAISTPAIACTFSVFGYIGKMLVA